MVPLGSRIAPRRTALLMFAFDPIADVSGMADARRMTLPPIWKGSELLHKLLDDYLQGNIDTPLFCSNFERAFNLDVDQSSLTSVESSVFKRLFDEVAYFPPFPEERAE